MYTRDELGEIRSRAMLEANVAHVTYEWRHGCLNLAAAADHLDGLTGRIESGEARAADARMRVMVLNGDRVMFEQCIDWCGNGLMPSVAEAPAVRDALNVATKTLESARITTEKTTVA
jgi:hypothetical protein